MKLHTFLIAFIFSAVLSGAPFFSAEAATIAAGVISPNAEVSVGTTISFQPTVAGFIGTVSYVLSDSLPGSTLSNANLSKSGQFSWTTQYADIGTHNVIITASDSYGNKSTLNQTLVVGQASPVSIKELTPGSSLFPEKNLSFSVTSTGYINPSYTFTDSFWGTSITPRNMSSDGNFGWTPTKSDVGVHNLAIRVTSPTSRSDTVYQSIVVNGILIDNVSSKNLQPGDQLTFYITAHGMPSPTYRVSDSLRGNSIDNGTWSENKFHWTPTTQDIGQHRITVTATDMYNNVSSADLIVTVSNAAPTTTTKTQINTPTNTNTAPTVSNSSTVTSTSKKFTLTKFLQVGSKGTEVIELQKKLKAEGYFFGPTNGNFGELTKAAVIKYQKAKKISPLGNVGPATRTALNT